MTSDDQEPETTELSHSAERGEVLDDEEPPDIPDILYERPRPPGFGQVVAELEALDDDDVADSSPISHKVVPPPKPARRRMTTSPQTPIARSTPPPPGSSETPPSSLRAPRTPSFSPAPVNPTIPEREIVEPVPEPSRPVPEPPRPVPEPPRPVPEPPRPVPEPPPAAGPSTVRSVSAEAEPIPGARPRARPITIPDDAVPTQGVSAEVTASSVTAMRIITVGDFSPDEAPPEIRDGLAGKPAAGEDAVEELDDADVAPDSGDSGALDHGVALPPGEVSDADRVASRQRRATPPPPPSESARRAARSRKEQPPVSADVSERKPQRRPWWEELFDEDFIRASSHDTDEQINREIDFIEESLGVAPGGVVLDLGCGAGYHAVELASRGYGVVGYDLSLFQLALAADVAQERSQKLNFLQGDMREMAFEEMFDGIYCWNTTFGYFEEEKNLAVAQRVFRALRPGGMFLLDVANRDFVAMEQPGQVWYEGDACVCMDDMSVDFITSRLRVKRNLILDDGRTRECNYSVRLYALHELGKLLHDVGFRVTEASGHLATPGVFFGTNSPRIIVLAQKP